MDGNGHSASYNVEVPEPFQQLVRNVIKTFYSTEAFLIADIVCHRPFIKEDDLLSLLHLDKRHLRQAIGDLRNDRVMHVRTKGEADSDGRQTRHNYFAIAYAQFLTVVRYKLDQMRSRIDAQERAAIRRTSFRCPSCHKNYSDLEVGFLLDPMTGQLLCTFCRTEVVENKPEGGNEPDGRQLITMLNVQLAPLFQLLRECESEEYAPFVMASLAAAADFETAASLASSTVTGKAAKQGESGDIKVNILAPGTESSLEDKRQQKELPIWMTKSTVTPAAAAAQAASSLTNDHIDDDEDGLDHFSAIKTEPSDGDEESISTDSLGCIKLEPSHSPADMFIAAAVAQQSVPSSDNDAILRTLLVHEKQAAISVSPPPPVTSSNGAAGDTEEATVSVGGRRMAYSAVTDVMVKKEMTEAEREEYMRVGESLYSNWYD